MFMAPWCTNIRRCAPRSNAPALTSASCRLYSPDFNPIELAFAKLKAFLRAARPRSFDEVCALIAAALTLFTPAECAHYIRHCGYRVSTSM